MAEALERRRANFVGSPTSYKKLSFSKPSNRLITNHQDFSDYTDPMELDFYGEPLEYDDEESVIADTPDEV